MKYRVTKNKKLILEALAPVYNNDYLRSEVLQAPYSAKELQYKLEFLEMAKLDLSNICRTLKTLEKQGMVVRDVGKVSVSYDLGGCNQGDHERDTTVWWRGGEHYEHDKDFARKDREEVERRFDESLERLFSR